ncbi:MAG: hypothetical protein ABIS10_04765 [Novosphingobium sp.]
MIDHFTGDATGFVIPAHGDALREGGAAWLTHAFHAFGSLAPGNSVTRIVSLKSCPGGSTGAKFYLEVEYAHAEEGLHRYLFVKFSRDFADERRDDRGRWEMGPEARFAPLSRQPGFPIAVPCAWFADYHMASGTGLIITESVRYGEQGIEPHRRKCLDHLTLDDPLAYYRQVVIALARLAASHKSGRLAPDIDARFPFNPATDSADPIRYSEAELEAELEHCSAYARDCPQLLPEAVRGHEFMALLAQDAELIRRHEATIQRYLQGDPRMIALCHWNAHIDNCWFWRDGNGELHCGLIDWGRVGQITFGAALWGGLSAAHSDIWDHHLDELLVLFCEEYAANGGPAITVEELTFHLRLHLAVMGVARVLAFPETIRFRLPEIIHAAGPLDPMLEPVAVDPARNSMHIYGVFLGFWRKYDVGGAVRELLERIGEGDE